MGKIKVLPAQKINEITNVIAKKRRSELTIEELRCYPGFENMTDQELNARLESLKEFSLLLYKVFSEQ